MHLPLKKYGEGLSTVILECQDGSQPDLPLVGIQLVSKSEQDRQFSRMGCGLKRNIPHTVLHGAGLETIYVMKNATMRKKLHPMATSQIGRTSYTAEQIAPGRDSDEITDIQSERNFEQIVQPRNHHKRLILCFDGGHNEFLRTESDSNILKIYRLLDRTDGSQLYYYRPGTSGYKAADLEPHVMGGYKVSGNFCVLHNHIFLVSKAYRILYSSL